MDVLARVAAGVILLAAAAAKVRSRRVLPDLVGAYGVPARLRRPAAALVTVAEGALGVLLVAGVAAGATTIATVVLGAVFVAFAAAARARGIRHLRCGCFGTRERSTSAVFARATGFTALAAVAAWGSDLRDPSLSRETLVLGALALLGIAVAVLFVLVLALYRQVGVLTLRLGPRAPLELAEEGPEVGVEAPPLPDLPRRGPVLVVFFSADCRLCRELAPAVQALAREGLPVRAVYEEEESEQFTRWRVPGTPFAVHVVDGVVGAKGLANTLEQLDDLVALGSRRRPRAA